MRPSKKINQVIEFCVAYEAGRTGVILAQGFLSNHFQVVTDVLGNLPEYVH